MRLKPFSQVPPDEVRRDKTPARGCCKVRRLTLRLLSIVGIDYASSYPYYRVKLETERVIEGSPVLCTILRATQFYDLVLMAVRFLERMPMIVVPAGFPEQSIDAWEVAGRLVELALSNPAGRVPDMGGPEVRMAADIVRDYIEITGQRKRTLVFQLPGKTGRAFRGGR